MMSFLSGLNPVPSFPTYRGPHHVGTQEFEIPTSEVSSDSTNHPVPTLNFRVFYPCEQNGHRKQSVSWLPSPHGEYFRGYAKFLGAAPWLAWLLSLIPFTRLIYHTRIPASGNAPLLEPSTPSNGRYPALIFSHGLGGTKNAYSHICGSLASYGVVVFALEHRDGSAPISVVRKTKDTPAQKVFYKLLGKGGTEKVADGRRDEMLKIRCLEVALLHEVLLKMDRGDDMQNLAGPSISFKSCLDVHTPGRIAFAGHSFGATGMLQFLKSVYHGNRTLLQFNISTTLTNQITPSTPTYFLDMWTLPLDSPNTTNLLALSLPCYDTPADSSSQRRPVPPMAISSSDFHAWTSNFQATVRAISDSPTSPQHRDSREILPLIFYPLRSAHLSQSDFGVLFQRIVKRFLGAEHPERTIWLNVRAILEGLRRSGTKVEDTIVPEEEKDNPSGDEGEKHEGQDWRILDSAEGRIRGWVAVAASPSTSVPVPDPSADDRP